MKVFGNFPKEIRWKIFNRDLLKVEKKKGKQKKRIGKPKRKRREI